MTSFNENTRENGKKALYIETQHAARAGLEQNARSLKYLYQKRRKAENYCFQFKKPEKE